MGILDESLRHLGTEAFSGLGMSSEARKEKGKWSAVFAVFALICMAAFFIQKNSMKGADLLGGRKTIERFMHSNITAMVMILASALGYIILCFKTWKGMKSSIYQLIFTGGIGLVVIYTGVSVFMSIHNIQKDLDSPLTVELDQYVLCMNDGQYMLGFDEQGTSDSIMLVIPAEKYNELKKGSPSSKGYLSRTWRLIEESEYVTYDDAVLYDGDISVTYYAHSVIYEDCCFAADKAK